MLQRAAELCWITEGVRLSRYLHNPTLVSMSDYTVNLQWCGKAWDEVSDIKKCFQNCGFKWDGVEVPMEMTK